MDIHDLLAGNQRFSRNADRALLQELSLRGQKPEVLVISCSDSRVPVEVIFDTLKPGTLFVVRVAGNVIYGSAVVGTIEYAVRVLEVPTIVLLGHTGCGAVKARMENKIQNGGALAQLCRSIYCRSNDLELAVVENLDYQFERLLRIASVRQRVRHGLTRAFEMVYNLQTGETSILKSTE